jgi:hypothetical protein
MALAQVERIVEPRAPGREVGGADLAVEPAVPGRRLHDAASLEMRAQLHARAEPGGRARGEAEGVLIGAVAQLQLQARERERRRAALLVAPLDLGLADDDLLLAEHPVAQRPVAALAGELDAGDVERAGGVAAHGEARAVHHQRMQPQVPVQERAPRDDVVHRGQHQRLASLRVVDAHVRNRDVGPQPRPARLDGADFHGQADGLRDCGDNIRAVALDVREHPVTQRKHQRGQREEREPGENFERSQQLLHVKPHSNR